MFGFGKKNSGDGVGLLRSSRGGGYDKRQALEVIDGLNTEILALEMAIAAKESGKPYSVPAPAAEHKLRQVMAGGFNKDDMDAYLSDLNAKIAQLRAKL